MDHLHRGASNGPSTVLIQKLASAGSCFDSANTPAAAIFVTMSANAKGDALPVRYDKEKTDLDLSLRRNDTNIELERTTNVLAPSRNNAHANPPCRDTDPNSTFLEKYTLSDSAGSYEASRNQQHLSPPYVRKRSVGLRLRWAAVLTVILFAMASIKLYIVLGPSALNLDATEWLAFNSSDGALKFAKLYPVREGGAPSELNADATEWRTFGSSDGALNIAKLYPVLEESASEDCKIAWEENAARLQCHSTILSSVFDTGNVTEALTAGFNPFTASQDVCGHVCDNSIHALAEAMRTHCNRRADRFKYIRQNHDRPAYFQGDSVEEGPLHVAQMLEERHLNLCAWGLGPSEWGTCAATLWMRWGIVSGRYSANINGVYEFLERTDVSKTLEGGNTTGVVFGPNGTSQAAEVTVPTRKIGPGDDETDCEYCTMYWLHHKMESFEVGKILDPSTGEAMTRREFHDVMTKTIRRCKRGADWASGQETLRSIRRKWARLGWWCDDRPCNEDDGLKYVAQRTILGLRENDSPLPEILELMGQQNGLRESLQALHDGLQRLPCSFWFSELDAVRNIVPYDHIIRDVCSDRCRNAVDRMQDQHGEDFDAAAGLLPPDNVFEAWNSARVRLDKMCYNIDPESAVTKGTLFCAPGYAALGRAEWIFANTRQSNAEIFAAFKTAVDDLDAKLPPYDPAFYSLTARLRSESVVNHCIQELLLGRHPNFKQRVDEFLDDDSVDGREYTRIAKLYHILSQRIALPYNPRFSDEQKWARVWKFVGLDRYD